MAVNGWNEAVETNMVSLGEQCRSYEWMHNRSALYYNKLDKIIKVTALFLSTIITTEGILQTESTVVNAFRTVFTMSLTFVTGLHTFLKYEQLAQRHVSAEHEFTLLYQSIQQQLCMERADRIDAKRMMSDNMKGYDNLVVNSPIIGKGIISDFMRTFKDEDFSKPVITDSTTRIEVTPRAINIPPIGTLDTRRQVPPMISSMRSMPSRYVTQL